MVSKYFHEVVITALPDACIETSNNDAIYSKYCMQLIVQDGVTVPFMFAETLEELLRYLKFIEKSTSIIGIHLVARNSTDSSLLLHLPL